MAIGELSCEGAPPCGCVGGREKLILRIWPGCREFELGLASDAPVEAAVTGVRKQGHLLGPLSLTRVEGRLEMILISGDYALFPTNQPGSVTNNAREVLTKAFWKQLASFSAFLRARGLDSCALGLFMHVKHVSCNF